MKAFPTVPGHDPDFANRSDSERLRPSPAAAAGCVWLLDPSRIGHLPACLRALGLRPMHARRED